jgi:hypothetical protein
MPAKKNQKKIQKPSINSKVWLVAGILCGLSVLFLLPNIFKGSKIIAPSIQKETITNTVPDNFPEFFKNIVTKVEAEQSNFTQALSFENKDVWWISSDNWNLLVPSKYLLEAHVRPIKNAQNQKVMARLQKIVDDEMTSDGWKINTINSSTSPSDTRFYDYVQAYEKGDLKCVATSSPDVGSSGEKEFYSTFNLGCFDNSALQQAYDVQVPFLKGLNEKDAVVSDIKTKGPRASMNVHWRRTGARGWMYNENGMWKKIIVTQAVPGCDQLEQNGVPQEYWITCYPNNSGSEMRQGSFDF